MQVRVGGKSPVMIHGEADQIRMPCARWWRMRSCIHTQGGAVGVSVALSSDGKNAVVRVIDHGEGVPKADLPRIFERFYRGSNQNERTTDGIGSGIGDRQACGARPSRRCDGVERSRAGQHVHAVAAGGGLIRLSCRDAGNPSGRNAPIPAS